MFKLLYIFDIPLALSQVAFRRIKIYESQKRMSKESIQITTYIYIFIFNSVNIYFNCIPFTDKFMLHLLILFLLMLNYLI